MTRAVRTLSIVGGILLLGWIGLLVADSSEEPGALVQGQLAALDSSRVAGWDQIAILDEDALASGKVRALDLVGDTLLVMQSHAWTLVVAGEVRGSYGSDVPGAPGFLARAEGIALLNDGVAVLDAARHVVTRWTLDGQQREDYPLAGSVERPIQGAVLHQALVAADSGVWIRAWLSAPQANGWVLTRELGARVDTVLRPAARPEIGESFNTPLAISTENGAAVLVDATTWRIRRLSPEGAVLDSASRPNPPRHAVPRRLARRMRENVTMMPETQRPAFAIGEALPSIRHITRLADGSFLTLTVADEEATYGEIIAADGTPLASLWSQRDSTQMFAVRGSLLRVRELDDRTLIERLRLRTP